MKFAWSFSQNSVRHSGAIAETLIYKRIYLPDESGPFLNDDHTTLMVIKYIAMSFAELYNR